MYIPASAEKPVFSKSSTHTAALLLADRALSICPSEYLYNFL